MHLMHESMRAVVCERYGPPELLRFRELPRPRPRRREVLIRIHATTVSSGDWRVRSLTVPPGFGPILRLALGFSGPRQPVLGTELVGVVAATGRDVRRYRVGDRVVGFRDVAMGCHAEYVCMAEDGALAPAPAHLSDAEAAALCFGGTTALDFLRRAQLRAGERVLVHGASGAVGTAAVQLARHAGAVVTAVCSGPRADLVRSLGASHVIDYTREDFSRNGERYDLILDAVGTVSFQRGRASLAPGGRLLQLVAGLPAMLLAPWYSLTSGHAVLAGPAAVRSGDVQRLADLAAAGHCRPVIDRCYPFEQIVAAHRYVDGGHKAGSVVITLAPEV